MSDQVRESLQGQLNIRAGEKKILDAQRHNLGERQTLEENSKRFDQKEKMRELDGKLKGMTVMDQNRKREMEKSHMYDTRKKAENHQFNQQLTEINLHATKREQEKRNWE